MQWIGIVLTGIIAGIAAGLFGIGGGVLIVPVLIIFLGFTTLEAVSTSLAALLMPVGVFAVIAYHKKNLVDLRASALMAVGLLVTSGLGAMGALEIERVDPKLMQQIYGVFLFVMGWRFMEPRKVYRETRGLDLKILPSEAPVEHPHWYILLLIGLVAGVLSGMFGIGGGIIIVPALTVLLHYDQRRAVGTSLGALLMPVGLPGVLVYYADGTLDLPVAAGVAAGLVVGSIIGARVALNLSSTQVKRLYGVFLLIVAIRFIFF